MPTIDAIVLSKDRKVATVHYDTHSVKVSHDTDVTQLVHEFFVEPYAKYQRSLEETMWIITLPEYKEVA